MTRDSDHYGAQFERFLEALYLNRAEAIIDARTQRVELPGRSLEP